MKKYWAICAGLCVVLAFSSCKSKESAYRKAYDKAKAQDAAVTTTETDYDNTPVVTPFVDTPVTDNSSAENTDNVAVRSENLTVVSGSGLKAYSVVVGSFSVKSNAESLVSRLRSQGYDAQLAYNSNRDMYRVVASTYADKASAVQSRTKLRNTYPDAWLLYYGY